MNNLQDLSFSGRVIVVSGASSGIGRATAELLARKGAKLVLIGRNRERLEATAANAGAENCHVCVLDLKHTEQILPAVREAHGKFGHLYGLCHAAGTVTTLSLNASTPDVVEDMLKVNYTAGLELCRAICRREILDPAGGSILFISGIYANIGKAGQIAYSGAKGAVSSAARAIAIELARRKVRVNVLAPGMVRTEMTDRALASLTKEQRAALEGSHPLGFGSPDDVAHAAAFLLSPLSKWITGSQLIVDGGCSAQ